MALPQRNLETLRLAAVRGALTGLGIGLTAALYTWAASGLDEFFSQPARIDWIFSLSAAALALGFPLLTLAERKLGPLRLRGWIAFALAFAAFTSLWAHYSTYLDSLSKGESWLQALETVLAAFQRLATSGGLGYFLSWCAAMTLAVLLLCRLRRARAPLAAQTLLPLALALASAGALRLYDFACFGLPMSVTLYTFLHGVPHGFGCAIYALISAWTDRRAELSVCMEAA